MTEKTFILDTNVYMDNPRAAEKFGQDGNIVVLLKSVFDELDRNKTKPGPGGRNAREALKLFATYETESEDDEWFISFGEEGFSLVLEESCKDGVKGDDLIIRELEDGIDVHLDNIVFVSTDAAMRYQVSQLFPHFAVEDFKDKSINLITDDFVEITRVHLTNYGYSLLIAGEDPSQHHETLYQPGMIETTEDEPYEPGINEYMYYDMGKLELMLVVKERDGHKILVSRTKYNNGNSDIGPRGVEQLAALDALSDPSISVVALTGPQGTGKTFLSMLFANRSSTENGTRIVITRATTVEADDEDGLLPGDLDMKMAPWIAPFRDAVDALAPPMSRGSGKGNGKVHMFDEYLEQGLIEIQWIGSVKGRSFRNTIMIVDESQDLTDHKVKKLGTRMGEGSKIIFVGDPSQVENPLVTASKNGLVSLVEKLKGKASFAHVHLVNVRRSELAKLFVDNL